jgi:hypothetical protein
LGGEAPRSTLRPSLSIPAGGEAKPRGIWEAGPLGGREDLFYPPETFVDIVFGKTVADAEIVIQPEVIAGYNKGVLFIDQALH